MASKVLIGTLYYSLNALLVNIVVLKIFCHIKTGMDEGR